MAGGGLTDLQIPTHMFDDIGSHRGTGDRINSGSTGMAGGGLVAFASGGDADDSGDDTGGSVPMPLADPNATTFAGMVTPYTSANAPPPAATATPLSSRQLSTVADPYHAYVAHAESRNRDYNPDGTPVTSPKGAVFGMQVMPATAHKPGYGVQPVQSETPQEYDRVGHQLLDKFRGIYGDAGGLAAYNMGPGAYNQVLAGKRTEPKETRDYVNKGMRFLSTNAPGPGLHVPTYPAPNAPGGINSLAGGRLTVSNASPTYAQIPANIGDELANIPPLYTGQPPTLKTQQPDYSLEQYYSAAMDDPRAQYAAPQTAALELKKANALKELDPADQKARKDQDMWMTIAEIGAGMAGTKSPYLLQAAGTAIGAALPGARKDRDERMAIHQQALQDYANVEGIENQQAMQRVNDFRQQVSTKVGLRGKAQQDAFENARAQLTADTAFDTEQVRANGAVVGGYLSGGLGMQRQLQGIAAQQLAQSQAQTEEARKEGLAEAEKQIANPNPQFAQFIGVAQKNPELYQRIRTAIANMYVNYKLNGVDPDYTQIFQAAKDGNLGKQPGQNAGQQQPVTLDIGQQMPVTGGSLTRTK
jgi:hypothetical protein